MVHSSMGSLSSLVAVCVCVCEEGGYTSQYCYKSSSLSLSLSPSFHLDPLHDVILQNIKYYTHPHVRTRTLRIHQKHLLA